MNKPFVLQLNINGDEHRWPMERKCLTCKSTGFISNEYSDDACSECDGTGMILTSMGREFMSFVWRHTHEEGK